MRWTEKRAEGGPGYHRGGGSTAEELQDIFDRAAEELEVLALGADESLDQVTEGPVSRRKGCRTFRLPWSGSWTNTMSSL